jgi:dynamin 1-like protein
MNLLSKKKIVKIGQSLQNKVDVIDSIRNAVREDGLDLPGIMVAGSQSSGKSSLLENLSGIQLPVGETITTRVPLIMKLVHKQKNEKSDSKNDVYIGKDIVDMTKIAENEIKTHIDALTKEVTGNNGSVVNKPIYLKIIQHEIPSMTVIDLPGITHMSKNDIQKDIHAETKGLVEQYMKNKNMVILCVVPAVDDFSNSEAIKLAKHYDPDGIRTMGVITKVDLYPYDIQNKLSGDNNYIGKNGFVAVRNRTPNDEEIKLKNIRKLEQSYFQDKHPKLEKMYWGIDTLINRIVQFQDLVIQSSIPDIKKKLTQRLQEQTTVMKTFDVENMNDMDKMSMVVSNAFRVIDKIGKDPQFEKRLNKLFATFSKELNQNKPNYFSEEMVNLVFKEIQDSQCLNLSNFMNIDCFKRVYLSNIDCINTATFNLMNKSFELLQEISMLHVNKVLTQLHKLIKLLTNNVTNYITRVNDRCKDIISDILESEKLIFTQNEYYAHNVNDAKIDEHEDYQKFNAIRNKSSMHSSAIDMCISLDCYHNVVIDRISDIIPMTILKHFKIDYIQKWNENIIDVLSSDQVLENMKPDSETTKKMKETEKKIAIYESCLKSLNDLE